MKSKKGFTLIELLAVIVILAVIALIATPIILNLIEKARLGAAESSAYAYIEAAEKAAVVTMMSAPNTKVSGACTVQEDKKSLQCTTGGTLTLDVKGDVPTGGSVTFGENGSVESATGLVIGSYTVEYSGTTGKATASATKS